MRIGLLKYRHPKGPKAQLTTPNQIFLTLVCLTSKISGEKLEPSKLHSRRLPFSQSRAWKVSFLLKFKLESIEKFRSHRRNHRLKVTKVTVQRVSELSPIDCRGTLIDPEHGVLVIDPAKVEDRGGRGPLLLFKSRRLVNGSKIKVSQLFWLTAKRTTKMILIISLISCLKGKKHK